MSKNNSWQKYEIYLTLSNRLHLQSTIFISDMQRPSRHRNLDASSHSFLFERGDIVRFGRREAEEFESEARKKVLLHT